MAKDKAATFVVVRLSATIIVHCEREANVPTFYSYGDAVQKMRSLKQQFPDSTWAVLPLYEFAIKDWNA